MSKKTKVIIRLVLKIVLYIVGAIIFFSAKNTVSDNIGDHLEKILTMAIGWILTGVFCGIYGFRQASDDYDSRSSSEIKYRISHEGNNTWKVSREEDDGCSYKVFAFIFFAAFGPIATPISCIIDIVSIRKNDFDFYD